MIRSGLHFGRHLYRINRERLMRMYEGKPANPPSLVAQTLDADDDRRVVEWLERPQDWNDIETVRQYERAFAAYNESEVATAFMGGRVALSAAIHALQLKPGDEVILPAFTCIVVPNAFHYAGVKIRFADIELDTYGLDVDSVRDAITSETKAILLHHLFGLICRDYEALLGLADAENLAVIEDCTHATGATFRGRRVGNGGDIAFYSSEHSKVFSTVQGGVATTNDPVLGRRLRTFADAAPFPSHNRIKKLLHTFRVDYYFHAHPHPWLYGDYYKARYRRSYLRSTVEFEMESRKPAYYGQRMPAPLAAIGQGQLAKIDPYNKRRQAQAEHWKTWCKQQGYEPPLVLSDSSPAWLRYPVLVEPERKADTTWALSELGVEPGVWFKTHLHPVQDPIFGPISGCPNADRAVKQCINLPTLPHVPS